MNPTLYCVPCFSGSPWDLKALTPLGHRALRTARLPEALDKVAAYADAVEREIRPLGDVVLVGDSFGALISLAVAARRPANLRGLVLSGGFAANPIRSLLIKFMALVLPVLRGPLYRHAVLRYHAANLSSRHDAQGDVPWTRARTRQLFLANTPHRSFAARTRAALSADLRPQLRSIGVPTLIITPADDRLIGADAAREMLQLIPGSSEVVLPQTGHMFRFSHPRLYAETIERFVAQRICNGPATAPALQAAAS
jgi:pimeloyl-ACP methyl ester carboxylesterase